MYHSYPSLLLFVIFKNNLDRHAHGQLRITRLLATRKILNLSSSIGLPNEPPTYPCPFLRFVFRLWSMLRGEGREGRIFADRQHCVSPAVSSSAAAAAPGVLGKLLFIRRLRWADREAHEKIRPEGKMDRRISHPP